MRCFVRVLIAFTFAALAHGQDEEAAPADKEKDQGGESEESQEGDQGPNLDAIVKLFVQDINEDVQAECTGTFVNEHWVLSAASCLSAVTSETSLKICGGSNPDNCSDSCYGHKVIFPRHAWYNNIALVYTDGGLNNTISLHWQKEEEYSPSTKDCRIVGFTDRENDAMIDVVVSPRRTCRFGYICVDDSTGYACDVNPGSPLICNGDLRGVYIEAHPLSCDGDTDEEEQWALLLFLNFEAYEEMIENVFADKFTTSDKEEVHQ